MSLKHSLSSSIFIYILYKQIKSRNKCPNKQLFFNPYNKMMKRARKERNVRETKRF